MSEIITAAQRAFLLGAAEHMRCTCRYPFAPGKRMLRPRCQCCGLLMQEPKRHRAAMTGQLAHKTE